METGPKRTRRKSRSDRRKERRDINFGDRRSEVVKDVEIETVLKENSVEIKFKNPIISVNSYQLSEIIDPLMRNKAIKTIIIDVKEVPYIDSVVLGAFLEYHKKSKLKGKKFILQNPQRLIRSLIKMMQLHEVLNIKFTSPDIVLK